MRQINFLQDLSGPQFSVVQAHHGPILVISGPGSGKTRTLVYRVAHMVLTGMPPEQILLLSFTRKAAQEMVTRVSGLLATSAENITGGTFHSVAGRILMGRYTILGFETRSTILGQGDAVDLIRYQRNIVSTERQDLKDHNIQIPNAKQLLKHFSAVRNGEKDMTEQTYLKHGECPEAVLWIYDLYTHAKRQQQVVDYDDLLFGLRDILRKRPGLREFYSNQYRYIMIDEYQDTNPVQNDIARLLASEHGNIMVVGDDAQSVYKFRGADIQNILTFPDMYPEATILRLEENHRSTPTIVGALNGMIGHATEKLDKTLVSVADLEDIPITLHAANSGMAQATWVVTKIQALHQQGVPYHDMAVLYRNTFHGNLVDMALTQVGVPFVKWGGHRFAEAAHVRDMLSFFRVRVNALHRVAWARVFELVPWIGPKTVGTILSAILDKENPYAALAAYGGKGKWVPRAQALGAMLNALDPSAPPSDLFDIMWEYYEPRMRAYRKYQRDIDFRLYGVQQFHELMGSYENLVTFLSEFTTEEEGDPQAEQDADQMILSTIHSAKGREWVYVFVPELVEGALPSFQSLEDEEELRLFYVAVSRAKQHVYLCYPRSRKGYDGQIEVTVASRFLQYIPQRYIEYAA